MKFKNNDWQQALIDAITDPKELLQQLELDNELLPAAIKASAAFPLKVTRSFLARMQKGNAHDPLLLQVLPLGSELEQKPGYSRDPLDEKTFNKIPGLLHKYQGRVLLTLTGSCGINCRFCFRRHFAYEENNPGSAGWLKAMDYIAQDDSITEVILSGGDPLVAIDQTFKFFSERLSLIPHVKRLRIHSRMPIVLPQRVTDEWLSAVLSSSYKTILVVHCNHPNEINSEVLAAMTKLADAGVLLLNQSVLLKGINDEVNTLVALSEALFASGIQPYYLHLLDKVEGAAHFDVFYTKAKELHKEMSERLPGYLLPRLVCEQPGAKAKILV